MTLRDSRARFLAGETGKADYIRHRYGNAHATLFDYASYLAETDIAAIEVTDGEVVMRFRKSGIRMACPPGDHRVAPLETLNFGEYEREETAMILALAAPARCILDIGANMGWYALQLARANPACTVHAFEPIPSSFRFLQRNIALNRLPNIHAHQVAMGRAPGRIPFYFYPEGSGNASAANLAERTDAEVIECPVERVDDVVRSLRLDVDFIKCDVEGAELLVFEGAQDTLAARQPVIFTEMLRKWSHRFGYHPNDLLALLAGVGYRCFTVREGRLREIHAITDDTLDTNFFLLHEARHREQIAALA